MAKKLLTVILLTVFIFALSGNIDAQTDDDSQTIIPGRIAFIGTDHNVYVIHIASDLIHQLTNDGAPTHRYQWPTWSTEGQLAYFCCDIQFAEQPGVEVYIVNDLKTNGDLYYQSESEAFTYASWSPNRCRDENTCGRLAVLLSQFGSPTFNVKIFEVDRQSIDVGDGSPFYYSWSPDGTKLILFRNNSIYEVFSLDGGATQRLSQTPGIIQAPAWSPIDDRLLVGLLNAIERTTHLAVITDDESRIFVDDIIGLVSFNWSPDGNLIAYRTLTNNGYGRLNVLDAVTGEQVAFTTSSDVIAFFWSPNSTKIAYVSPTNDGSSINTRVNSLIDFDRALQQNPQLSWAVLDVESGITQRFTNFQPTPEMVYLFSFFDQFAQSHRIWSPDSNYVVFGEITQEDKTVLSILDVNRAGAVPFLLAEGRVGIWSYE